MKKIRTNIKKRYSLLCLLSLSFFWCSFATANNCKGSASSCGSGGDPILDQRTELSAVKKLVRQNAKANFRLFVEEKLRKERINEDGSWKGEPIYLGTKVAELAQVFVRGNTQFSNVDQFLREVSVDPQESCPEGKSAYYDYTQKSICFDIVKLSKLEVHEIKQQIDELMVHEATHAYGYHQEEPSEQLQTFYQALMEPENSPIKNFLSCRNILNPHLTKKQMHTVKKANNKITHSIRHQTNLVGLREARNLAYTSQVISGESPVVNLINMDIFAKSDLSPDQVVEQIIIPYAKKHDCRMVLKTLFGASYMGRRFLSGNFSLKVPTLKFTDFQRFKEAVKALDAFLVGNYLAGPSIGFSERGGDMESASGMNPWPVTHDTFVENAMAGKVYTKRLGWTTRKIHPHTLGQAALYQYNEGKMQEIINKGNGF